MKNLRALQIKTKMQEKTVLLCSFAYGDPEPSVNGFEKQEICINSVCHLSGEKFYETVTFC